MAEYEPTTLSKEYARYIRSGVWRCDKSPTGAHHWIDAKVEGAKSGTFVCKYCWEIKVFPLSFYGNKKEKEK